MRQHVYGWAADGQLLFCTWVEGLALFDTMVEHFPGMEALCVMPQHTHVVGAWPEAEERQVAAQSAYARWRNARRGESGPAWAPHPSPTLVANDEHARRTVRYVHMNPCREGLVACPLAWPLSTHRDACGLVIAPVIPRSRQPEAFHRYVSSDPSTSVSGTPFPELTRQDAVLAAVIDAASAAGRFPVSQMTRRGEARDLAIGVASLAGISDARLLAASLGCGAKAVSRQLRDTPTHVRARDVDPGLLVAATVLNDPRFQRIDQCDLRLLPEWRRWRGRR